MRRQSGPEEKDFTRYILLTTVLSYLTLATFISAGRETTRVDCKVDFRWSVCLTAAFSHCGCFAIRRPVDYSTSLQRNWTPYCVHEHKDVNRAHPHKDVMGCAGRLRCIMFTYTNLQVEYLAKVVNMQIIFSVIFLGSCECSFVRSEQVCEPFEQGE